MSTVRVNSFAQLVEGYQLSDPKLYQILSQLMQVTGAIQEIVDPSQISATTTPGSGALAVAPAAGSISFLAKQILRIVWLPSVNAVNYELREGTFWDTATFITQTTQLEARLDPILVGTHHYLVKAINSNGIYSVSALALTVTIPNIGASSITASVIDNNVLLKWSEPVSTWLIRHYNVYRDGVFTGTVDATFFVIFEQLAGTRTYGIQALDLAGNLGPINIVTASVNQPPDFELQDTRLSLLAGTRTNAIIYGEPEVGWEYNASLGWIQDDTGGWFASYTGKILVCVDTSKTWTTHFTSQAWTDPQDQINAGFPIYIQPTVLTAQYQEIIDYESVINNIILNLSWTLEQISLAGTVTVTSQIEFSLDAISWTAPVAGPSAFSPSFRYARITFNFVANNTQALAIFSNLQALLDVKREVDSGVITANAADAGGTEVFFNKAFKDIDSITLTPTKQIEPLNAVYDFTDIPNPVHFFVYVFDSIGNRVTATCSWKARGIV